MSTCVDPVRRIQAVANRLAGMSLKDSLTKAGYSESYADSGQATQFFSRPEIQSRMTRALERAKPGVIDLAAKAVMDALGAQKSLVVYQGKDEPAEVIDKPDHDIRLKAVDRIVGVFGFIPGKVEQPTPQAPPIVVNFTLHQADAGSVKAELPPVETLPFEVKLLREPS